MTAEREQWDDGNNTLAIAPGLVVAYERNRETNARLEEEGIQVLPIAGSELGTGRGGPRCMSCPVWRTAPGELTPPAAVGGRRRAGTVALLRRRWRSGAGGSSRALRLPRRAAQLRRRRR